MQDRDNRDQTKGRPARVTAIVVASFAASLVFACSAAPPPEEHQASTSQGITQNTCVHPLCTTGIALASTCDPCATQLCAADPYCCSTAWDATCVGEVTSICGTSCTAPPPPPPPGGNTCAHPLCATGIALASTCSPCATQLCTQDPYCCVAAWDATCVGEVTSICGQSCN
jgi:hypothetical protein